MTGILCQHVVVVSQKKRHFYNNVLNEKHQYRVIQ